jgi:hypothetical protein
VNLILRVGAAIAALVLFACSVLMSQQDLTRTDQDRLRRDLTFLSSDSLKGRAAGTSENTIAAYYIAREFKAAGLKPLPNQRPAITLEDTTAAEGFEQADSLTMFFQKFSLVRTRLSEQNGLNVITSFSHGSQRSKYNTPSDFYIQYTGQTGLTASAPAVLRCQVCEEQRPWIYRRNEGRV